MDYDRPSLLGVPKTLSTMFNFIKNLRNVLSRTTVLCVTAVSVTSITNIKRSIGSPSWLLITRITLSRRPYVIGLETLLNDMERHTCTYHSKFISQHPKHFRNVLSHDTVLTLHHGYTISFPALEHGRRVYLA